MQDNQLIYSKSRNILEQLKNKNTKYEPTEIEYQFIEEGKPYQIGDLIFTFLGVETDEK